MDIEDMLSEATRILEGLGIKVLVRNLEDSDLPVHSGLVRVKCQEKVYLHTRLNPEERLEILLEVLKKFDLEDIYFSPALRERLEMDD